MTEYRYRAVAYDRTTGEVRRDETIQLTAQDLYLQQGDVGALAFHQLINRWNRQGRILNAGPINIYTVEP